MSKQKKLIPELRFPEFIQNDNWQVTKLGDAADFINGRAYRQDELLSTGKYRVLRVGNFFTNNEWYYSNLELDEDKYCEKGDLLYAWSASFGPRIWQEEKVIYHYHIWKVKNKYNIDKSFLFYLLDYETFRMKAKSLNGFALMHITKGTIEAWESNAPKSEKEQQKIASCLSSLDEVITAHSQKLELLKEHKKGLMQNLFPQDGEKVPRYRFKEFEKDGEWVEKTLGQVTENVMYGMNAAAINYDGQNKYIRITDIDEDSRLFVPNPLTSPSGLLEEKYIVNVNDLLFARTGASVGKSYLHKKQKGTIYFAGFLIRFTIRDGVPYFIYAQTLTKRYQKWVIKTSMRSGQPGINAEEYKSLPILLPPTTKEQQKIASCLSALDELFTAQANKIEQLKLHKKGLMQGLFPQLKD